MRDLPNCFNDRVPLFDPIVAAFIKATSTYFATATQLTNSAIPLVSHIHEEDASRHALVITAPENSASAKNYYRASPRASSIVQTPLSFTSPPSAPPVSEPGASFFPAVSNERFEMTNSPASSYNENNLPVTTSALIIDSSSEFPEPEVQPDSRPTPIHGSAGATPTPFAVAAGGSIKPPVGNAGRQLPPSPVKTTAPTATVTTKQAQALYKFMGEEDTELSFEKGDIIIIHKSEGEWWEGELNGNRGTLPSNYVKLI